MSTDTEIVDVEPVETEEHTRAAIAPAAQPTPGPGQGGALALFGTTDPIEVVAKAKEVAAALMEPVEAQQLYLEKQDGRRYLNVEAWTLLASMLQVRAIPTHTEEKPDHNGNWHPPVYHVETEQRHSKWCKNGSTNRRGEATHDQTTGCRTYEKEVQILDEPGAGGFTSRVEARDAAGNVIGAANSRCMWEEWKWRDRDAYALESMAQTRGISKALSGPLRFIVELAGFKGTPAEEVDSDDYGRPARSNDSGQGGSDPRANDFECPACGEQKIYDNREDNDRRKAAGEDVRTPAFRCGNKACTGGKDGRPWATWDPHHFTDPTTRAKQRVYKATKANPDGWARQYPADDPSYDDRAAELVRSAHEGTAKEKAGWLWHRLRTHTDIIGWAQGDDTEPTERQAEAIVAAAKRMLAADEPLSELEALEAAYEAQEEAGGDEEA